jgi:hypothetical protein
VAGTPIQDCKIFFPNTVDKKKGGLIMVVNQKFINDECERVFGPAWRSILTEAQAHNMFARMLLKTGTFKSRQDVINKVAALHRQLQHNTRLEHLAGSLNVDIKLFKPRGNTTLLGTTYTGGDIITHDS